MDAMRPRPRATMPSSTIRVGNAAPRRLTSKSRHQVSAGTSSNSPHAPASPALLTSRSIGPSSSSTRAVAATTAARSVTSHAIARPSAPGGGRRDQTETRAPARARSAAIVTPMPRVPPVTTATWPVRGSVWIIPHASAACADASRTARGIAGQGGTLSKILRAGAVAIAESPTKYGL